MAIPQFTVGDLQADVTRKVHGAVSQSFYGSVNEAARWFLGAIDAYETKRRAYIENALYDQVDKYYLPPDTKDQKIIDIRKQAFNQRTYRDSFTNIDNKTFDKYNSTGNGWGAWRTYTIESDDNIKYIRINDQLPNTTLIINKANSLTDNGNWNTYGILNNLQLDQLNYLTGNGSLRFDMGTGTYGALENAGISSVDLTGWLQVGAIFTWVYLPSPSSLISVLLKWGSSPTDYNSFVVNAPHNNTVWNIGWNLCKFPLDGYNVFGNPNNAAITQIRLEFQTTGAPMTGVRIDNIVARKGILYEIQYYSSYLFSDPVTGLWKPTTFDMGDLINLSTTSYNILMLKVAAIEAQEVRNSPTDVAKLESDLEKELSNYWEDNKSEYIKNTETYLKMVDPTRNQFYGMGGGW